MPNIIRIDYKTAKSIASSFSREAAQIKQISQALDRRSEVLRAGDWQGKGAQAFYQEMESTILPAFGRLEKALAEANRVIMLISGIFQQAELEAASYWSSSASNSPVSAVLFPWLFLNPRTLTSFIFNQQWANWTTDKRLDFLKRQYAQLASKYGLTKVPVVSADLPGSFFLFLQIGDTQGQFIGDKIEIDVDNLKSTDGQAMLTTLIHETRHQIQFEMVNRYEKDGDQAKFPDGITLEQVKTWHGNYNNYKKAEDDFVAYWIQPVEIDARDFADKNVQDYAVVGEYAA